MRRRPVADRTYYSELTYLELFYRRQVKTTVMTLESHSSSPQSTGGHGAFTTSPVSAQQPALLRHFETLPLL